MLLAQQKALYRMMLHARLSKLAGMAFQNFFSEAMRYANPNFLAVKPQGQEGDWKNDGHDPVGGLYYQVYSPEQFIDESAAIKKLKEDFAGLHAKWSDGKVYPNGIKEFYFVINDGRRVVPGGYPTTLSELAKLKAKYSLTQCQLFLQKDLEDVILNLQEDQIISLVGYPPNPSDIRVLDLQLIDEVVIHIVESTSTRSLNQTLADPDFEEKIAFNDLKLTGNWLRDANYRVGTLEDYFKANSDFTRQDIRDRLKSIYEKNRNGPGTAALNPDERLFRVLDEICPKPPKNNARLHKEIQDAALVILAFFFESCDIFEEPSQC